MAMQQQTSSLAAKFGGRLSAVAQATRDKPIDRGMMKLPPGMKNAVAKLQVIGWFQQEKDGGMIPKGGDYCRAAAVVVFSGNAATPDHHNGIKVTGMQTSVFIPLCDIPAKGQRKATSFDQNLGDFVNLLKLLSNGALVCHETTQTDPTGQKTDAFYRAAMASLINPQRPVYVQFSTRGWTPPKTALQPNPEEMVFETWHQVVDFQQQHNPAAAVTDTTMPPSVNGAPQPAHVAVDEPLPDGNHIVEMTHEEEVSRLTETALGDPDGQTDEGYAAIQRLQELAQANGWDNDAILNADGWGAVADMALTAPPAEEVGSEALVTIGSKWKYVARTKEGAPMKNSKGEDLPPREVEVIAINEEAKTCNVKTTKDNKAVLDVRTRKPVDVKFEWLEE